LAHQADSVRPWFPASCLAHRTRTSVHTPSFLPFREQHGGFSGEKHRRQYNIVYVIQDWALTETH